MLEVLCGQVESVLCQAQQRLQFYTPTMLTADSAESEEMLRMGACSGIVRQCAFISGIVSRVVSVSIYQWHCSAA